MVWLCIGLSIAWTGEHNIGVDISRGNQLNNIQYRGGMLSLVSLPLRRKPVVMKALNARGSTSELGYISINNTLDAM